MGADRAWNELVLAEMVAARAEEAPDLDVLTFENGAVPDEVRTYADLVGHGASIASALAARGMRPGDRFGLLLRNHPEFVETMVAASMGGFVFVPLDPRTRGEKLAFTLRDSQCKGVVCADYSLAQVAAIRDQVPTLEWLLVLASGEEAGAMATSAVKGAESFAKALATPAPPYRGGQRSGDDPLEILYTSGTTGDPKGVVCSNARYAMATMFGSLLGFQSGDRPYTGLSLTHGNAQMMTLAPSLGMKLRVVFSRKFTKSRLWDITRKYGCTIFNLLGGMATAIYSEPLRDNDADNPVRFVLSAGMPAVLWEAFEKRFGVKIFECYGAIEGGLALNPVGVGPIGSFGKPPPNLDMRIVDDDGNECPAGVIGELVSRPAGGEEAVVEYFRNEEASRAKTRGGWLRSGDLCHTDAAGWFYFDCRRGGGIRHNGDFVNPGFVEKVVAEHPDVTDVFVYGVPAASGAPGEKDVVAAVVAADSDHFDAIGVFRHCERGLEGNFVPSFLQVVAEIPKTASEKPQERFLVERFATDASGVFRRGPSPSA